MPSHRMGRTTEDIRRELTAIFRELKDPRVQGLISIVRVDVSSDLSYCTVYISAMEGIDHAKQAIVGLKSASGYIRRELGQRLRLRHVPEMHFKATDSIEYSANISRILNDLPASREDGQGEETFVLGRLSEEGQRTAAHCAACCPARTRRAKSVSWKWADGNICKPRGECSKR